MFMYGAGFSTFTDSRYMATTVNKVGEKRYVVPPSDAHQRGKDADEAFSGAPRHLSDTSGAEGQNTRLALTPTLLQHTHTPSLPNIFLPTAKLGLYPESRG